MKKLVLMFLCVFSLLCNNINAAEIVNDKQNSRCILIGKNMKQFTYYGPARSEYTAKTVYYAPKGMVSLTYKNNGFSSYKLWDRWILTNIPINNNKIIIKNNKCQISAYVKLLDSHNQKFPYVYEITEMSEDTEQFLNCLTSNSFEIKYNENDVIKFNYEDVSWQCKSKICKDYYKMVKKFEMYDQD